MILKLKDTWENTLPHYINFHTEAFLHLIIVYVCVCIYVFVLINSLLTLEVLLNMLLYNSGLRSSGRSSNWNE